jgi:magnesium-transporting ATPase (P-type)
MEEKHSFCELIEDDYFVLFNFMLFGIIALVSMGVGVSQRGWKDGWMEGEGVPILVLYTFSTFAWTWRQKSMEDQATIKNDLLNYGTATVIRDGNAETVTPSDIVVGDILELTEGTKIEADCVLLQSNNLKTIEAEMTGE